MRKTLLLAGLVVSIIACGGGSEGYQEYGSVAVGITGVTPTNLQSDVVVKKDVNGDGVCDTIYFQDDTVVVTLSSLSIVPPEGNYQTSPVLIDKYKLTFVNASSANNCEKNEQCRVLFSVPLERFVSASVEPGGTTNVTISVIPADWKSNVLINYCFTPFDSCVYNVILEVHAVEAFSGQSKWLRAMFTVQIADYQKGNSLTVDGGNIVENAEPDDNCILSPGG